MKNKPKMVKQWWLLFHDTKPELNFISTIARTELLNHVQQQLKNNQQELEGLAKSNFAESARQLAETIKKYHTIDYDLMDKS